MWKHLENSYNRVLYFNGERDERINEDNRERECGKRLLP